jgi:hypothetical protein
VADVVIAGYGPAGAAAAIAAHDAGRSVLILESAERGGGNARYSGGFLFDVPGDAAVAHLDALCFGRTGHRVLEAYAAGLHELDGWLCSLGGTTVAFEPPPARLPAPFPSWPRLPAGRQIRYQTVAGGTGRRVEARGTFLTPPCGPAASRCGTGARNACCSTGTDRRPGSWPGEPECRPDLPPPQPEPAPAPELGGVRRDGPAGRPAERPARTRTITPGARTTPPRSAAAGFSPRMAPRTWPGRWAWMPGS